MFNDLQIVWQAKLCAIEHVHLNSFHPICIEILYAQSEMSPRLAYFFHECKYFEIKYEEMQFEQQFLEIRDIYFSKWNIWYNSISFFVEAVSLEHQVFTN